MEKPKEYFVLFLFFLSSSCEAVIYSDATDDFMNTSNVVQLGGLFPVHKNEDNTCGQILDLGVQRLEAMVYAIDLINGSPMLLPNVSMKFEIRDTCVEPNIALEESLRFVRNRGGTNNITFSGISGVVGAASSGISIVVANLLRLFQVPQISYASTAKILSDKTRYDYFFRTLPPDSLQAKAMTDIIVHFNWTYIHAIYSDDTYGSDGIDSFLEEVKNRSNITTICIASMTGISPGVTNEAVFESVVTKLNDEWVGNSSVIVLFGQLSTATGILAAVKKIDANMPGFAERFTWIGSDAWGDQLPAEFHSVARGLLGVTPKAGISMGFDRYFQSLNPMTYTANPWFREYWSSVFNCTFSPSSSSPTCDPSRESISPANGYRQNSKVTFTIDAVFAFAHAIHNLITLRCPNNDLCPDIVDRRSGGLAIQGELLLEKLRNVSFSGESSDRIEFDSSGDEPGEFVIKNLKKVRGSKNDFYYEVVGKWSSAVNLDLSGVIEWSNGEEEVPLSVCSLPCKGGEFQELISGQSNCCWECEECPGDSLVSEGITCEECMLGLKPNEDRSACVPIIPGFLKWSDPWAIIFLLLTFAGLACTTAVMIFFLVHRNHPVIKASSRELSGIILVGIFCCYLVPLFFLAKPSVVTCILRRFSVGVAFSICYGALLVKTNRIYRIFSRAQESLGKPTLISPQSQVIFTLLLVSFQVVVAIVWLTIERPEVTDHFDKFEGEKVCAESPIASFVVIVAYNLVLLISSTIFGIKSRKIPQNFNESKLINFTLISTICVWIGLAPAYFTTAIIVGAIYQTISLLIAILSSATIMLVLLFLVKVYIILSEKRKIVKEGGEENYFRERANSLASVNAITDNAISLNRLSIGSPNRPTSLFPPGGYNTSNTLLSAASSPTGSASRFPSLAIPSISINRVGAHVPFPSPAISPSRSAGSTPYPSPYSSPTGSGSSFLMLPRIDATTQTQDDLDEKISDTDILRPDSTSSLDVKIIPPTFTVTLSPASSYNKLSGDPEEDDAKAADNTIATPASVNLGPAAAKYNDKEDGAAPQDL